jgi:gas vesicle protein
MDFYLDEKFEPQTEIGKKLKRMVENGDHCDSNIYWLISQVEQLQYQKKYFEEDNERHLDTLADVRDELLDYVDVNNPCKDMLTCTVSNPDCMKCLAKNIKGVIEQLRNKLNHFMNDAETKQEIIYKLQRENERLRAKNNKLIKEYGVEVVLD